MNGEVKPLILVVDDEPDMLSLNRFILEQKSYQVITAGDGVDAIQKAVDFSPDVILLDVMMPRMNGYQVCRLLKNDRRTDSIPIIICTVKSLESEKLYAYTSGADEYLVKPFDKEQLIELVKKCLKGRTSRLSPPLHERETPRSRTSTDSILSDVNSLLDRRLMELTILQDLTKTIGSTLDFDVILREIQRGLHDLGYPGVKVLLLEKDGMLVERTSGESPLSVDSGRYPLFAEILGGKDAYILSDDDVIRSVPVEFNRELTTQTLILVPIHAKGKPTGIMLVENTVGQTVNRNQKDFLLTLANQAGQAMENANLYEKTLQLSITDGLTEIYNYRYFHERLENEIARSKRYGNTLGLIIIDIDHFKKFNDQYGHLIGDEILRNVAKILMANTRDVDVVARYGGEEFGVILSEIDMDETVVYAERIRESVEKFAILVPDGSRAGVTVSLGVTVCCTSDMDEREFVRRADQALYRAKELGRNRICIWKKEGDHLCPAVKEKEGA